MCKKVGKRRTTRKSTTHQKCKTNTKLWSFGYTLSGHLTTWQESNLVQEKPFLWAQDWRLQQEWKGNELYKAHVSRSKQQSTKESFSSFKDWSQLSEISFISKVPLSLALQVGNKVTKSSSPINRRLQQEEHTTFEQKKKNIFIKNLLFTNHSRTISLFWASCSFRVLNLWRRLILFKFKYYCNCAESTKVVKILARNSKWLDQVKVERSWCKDQKDLKERRSHNSTT